MPYQKIPHTGRLNKKPFLKIRDIPEWRSALVFDPDQPELRMINLTSRLIIELCDGRSKKEIEEHYCSLVSRQADDDTARQQFRAGLEVLKEHDLVTAH